MSDNSSLQQLAQWAQSKINALYEHPDTSLPDDNSAPPIASRVQSLFAPTAQIYLNHTGPVPPEEFSKQLEKSFGTSRAEVEWKECFEVLDDNEHDAESETVIVNERFTRYQVGIVAGYFIITRTLKFRIRAAPAKNYTHVSFSAKYKSIGDRDTRQIVQLFYTSMSKPAPVHIQGVHRT
ncbi:hypothetical protein GGU10DRAFT_275605 [Lentinula aff. detonsa]|uniref:Uncharacterized protein n=1 Tax=Lentinula aff. detonsa TaxID=2804958 RepID=A0AA38L3W5_9AGAR|nr:hypothetical protein GGU10DRAFT_275605 [Lentinula aff. detonsa]